MNAQKALITNIFNISTLLEVPFFQRSYVWKDDLWARLIEDMEFVTKTKKPHYLGSIILKEGHKPQPGDLYTECWTVVDGQQRLTTLLIFLKVLHLKLGESLMFNMHFRIMGKEIALRLGKNDIEAFKKVMNSESAFPIDNTLSKSRIIEAYNYFIEHVDQTKLDIMTLNMNIQFVRINLDATEDEQQIFDTLNSLGVNLTTSELLKNYFFNKDTVSEYESKWAAVFEKDDDAKTYWNTEIETGRVKRAMIDIFFDSYFQLFIQNKHYNISAEDKLMYDRVDHLSQSYQHFINNYCGGDKNVVLGKMKEYAECFKQTFRPEYCKMNIPAGYGIERLNIVIFGLKTSTLIPYVLYIAKNIPDENKRNDMYRILESYTMRRIVVHASTKNYNNLFNSLILNSVADPESLLTRLKDGNDETTYFPNDDDLKQGFDTSKLVNLQSKGIIYLIESGLRKESYCTKLLGFDGYSLEHMMPKKWKNNWAPCTSDDLAAKRDSVLLTLGNLAIITQTLNVSIRDADWPTKKAGKPNKPGLSECADGLKTISDALNKDVWNEEEIANRANWLFEQAKSIWKL